VFVTDKFVNALPAGIVVADKTEIKSPAGKFAFIPPPTLYVIVKVTFCGDSPKDS